MKKLLVLTAGVALAFSTVTGLVGQSNAAPTRSSYCDMAKSQRNPVAWNSYYNCIEKPAAARVVERKREFHAGNPYCDLAKSQRNPVSWNARYGCLSQR
jgi:hypothetical protein